MTPQDLKNSVLQRAIQGKLVPQDPKEGSGEELLRQIREEKTRLLKDGKIKKEKPLPDIDDEEKPFEIPDNWVWVRLGDVVILNPKNHLSDETEVGFIPMTLVSGGYGNQHSSEIRYWKDVKKSFTHFANGDIGFAKITPCFQNRKSVVFQNLKNGYGAGTTELSVVRVLGDTLSREFILSFFKSSYFIDNGVKSFTGTAGQQRIHKDYLSNCLFPLPPLSEQKRIVSKLESLQPHIESYGRAWTRLEELSTRFPSELRKSLLQRAIEGRLVARDPSEGTGADLLREIQKEKKRLVEEGKIKKEKPLPEITDDEKPFEIPGHWTWVRLGDCAQVYNGNSINAEEKQRKYSKQCDGLPFIATKDVGFDSAIDYENGVYIPKGIESFKIAPKGSVLLCMEGGSAGKKIGRLTQDVCFGNKLCCFAPFVLNSFFLFYFMQCPSFISCFTGNISGMIGGVGTSKLRNMLVPLPPLSEQKRIVSKLEELLPLCERLTVVRR